ncbi:hypothetical protein COT87_01760 [Candidatus Collierbacteria bacterium CG10_big_fil_rev_8_21_14_0_10_44_9]|uniref:M23ase beta-sheet core domain-containing protein n=1 Tax=Candidatus Collierbacteria bacterium CG10_big_fil_rev_8_21_14_0_10_44_9 TaxID=1974535 RepID=A0A2H0VIU7_9BACT|nr:MAG: hypothetical protein COT87_01760 [Candidatus Collierbacteria bacterium CG10_big_fil_rev_8_21_14_0_10_44_9]
MKKIIKTSNLIYTLTVVVIILIALFVLWQTDKTPRYNNQNNTNDNIAKQENVNSSNKNFENNNHSTLVFPVAEFKERITKKSFGTYVNPNDSPVSPERFQGYHTGVDVEYADITTDVAVVAIADGLIVFSGRVSGYGGLVVIRHNIDGKSYLVFYGHLNPSSLLAKDASISAGQEIGQLGQAYSSEIDGERRHLHLAVYTGSDINMLGYTQTKEGLSKWIDPLTLWP